MNTYIRAVAAAAVASTSSLLLSDTVGKSLSFGRAASCELSGRTENISRTQSERKNVRFFPGADHSLNRLHHYSKLDLELEYSQVIFTSGARVPASPLVSKSATSTIFYPADTNHEGLNLVPILFYRESDSDSESDDNALPDPNERKLVSKEHVQNEIESTISRSLLHKNGVRPMELTRKGQKQAIDLGKRLRERYRGRIIPSMWSSRCNDLIKTKSLLSESCINTAQGVLTGLYEGRIPEEMPALVNVKPLKGEEEWMQAAVGSWCPILQKLFFSAMHVSAGKLLDTKEGKQISKVMNDKLGFRYGDRTKVDNEFCLLEFRDLIVSNSIHSDTKPNMKLEDRVNALAAKQVFESCSGGCEDNRVQVTRLLIGRFLRRLVDNLENDNPSKRLQLFATDDITMMALYMCIDPYGKDPEENTRRWPSFCDELSFELWRDRTSGIKLVRVLLRGEPFHLPGIPCATGGSFYDMDTFRNALQKYILFDEDIDSACVVRPSTGSTTTQ
mmetsp:Transcript_11810/g.13662  ORF Transcript_11810/g.13662 Transcript_11810/m.13662 type:complete len:503 (-) Transcript_11810:131-1639(-)|eukprot:CAMPEP_0204832534 /NCGR_PEP_ID=MMETSP1346-20131115/14066_1 /ASSEMBLY_ACC=CAM_ASM_000771 /TAXON_ID=215587 /ORGANISM="Aplanochytrium stocchinoi, Strain GSBS06" /LENGTH=502 /DNA_ID=CAMNT_0051964409 /DNA_START=246 /DNA_END=1754 /DNA_ORIENTATION=-